MTEAERREAEDCFLSWMRDNQNLLATCWANKLRKAPWFPALEAEQVQELAYSWLSLAIEAFAERGSPNGHFADTLRRCTTFALDAQKIRRCFELLAKVQLSHVRRDFVGPDSDWASRLVVEHNDALRQKCEAV